MTGLDEFQGDTLREGSISVLETERLCLRAPRLEDAKAIAMLANDRRVAENTARIPHPYRLDDAAKWIAAANTRLGVASYVIARADTVIGACGFDLRDGTTPEIGYWIGVPFWGQGYATEAVRGLIDHAFGDLELPTLLAGARVTNPASRRVLEKCGFQWSGVALYRIRALHSSAPVDRFRLDRGIWQALKSWGRTKPVVRRVA